MNNSNEEVVDIVDENDNVVGEALRVDTNFNPSLIHREIGIILFDDQKRILIQKRSKTKKVHPSMWGFTAGHVGKGKTPEEAAHTEMMEEIGFDTKIKFLEKELNKIPTESRFVYWYGGKIPNNVKVVLDPVEVEKIEIVSQQDFNNLINSGEKITDGLLKISQKFWSGKYDLY